MRKLAFLAYAAIAYVLAMANLAYLVGFFADVGVPKSIASGTPALPVWQALVADACLVLGFGLHHSLTARSAFKRRWTRIVPPPLERATYLYMTAAMTAALVLLWQPIPITIWSVEPDWAVGLILTGYLSVWGAMFVSTFQFGHLGFFGLAQVWRHVQGCRTPQPYLATRFLYGIVRHPISAGWMLIPWITPHLTLGHAVFGAAAIAYVLAATPFEEGDLAAELGRDYERYRATVPAFLPRARRDDARRTRT